MIALTGCISFNRKGFWLQLYFLDNFLFAKVLKFMDYVHNEIMKLYDIFVELEPRKSFISLLFTVFLQVTFLV